MEREQSQGASYLSPTAPEWADYYQRAKRIRRLGKGQHARIQRESKRRRRQANIMLFVSTALLLGAVAGFCALLGS
jgi:hypothetical protein